MLSLLYAAAASKLSLATGQMQGFEALLRAVIYFYTNLSSLQLLLLSIPCPLHIIPLLYRPISRSLEIDFVLNHCSWFTTPGLIIEYFLPG